MKKIIEKFKKFIRFVVTIFASREFAFIYCLSGTLTQVAHTYFLASAISSFHGNFKIFQAVVLSTFISSSLLYFVSIADSASESKESKRIFLAINIFMVIEILINIYYYSRHLIIDVATVRGFDFMFAVLISCLIPVTIKLYANSIKAKEWIEEMSEEVFSDKNGNIEFDINIINSIIDEKILALNIAEKLNNGWTEEKISEFVTEKTKTIYNEMVENIDKEVSNIFTRNQNLFISQFENKVKLIIQKSEERLIETKETLTEK